MPTQAFVDESGIDGQGPFLVFAGLIGQAEDWARFSADWRAVLDMEPKIPVFRMHDAAACRGAFRGWSWKARDKRLRQLVDVIARHPLMAIHCTMDIVGFTSVIRDQHRKPLNQMYFWPFHMIIMAVAHELLERGEAQRFEIIFDENAMFGNHAKRWFPITKAMTEAIDPEMSAVLPVEPMFKADDEFLPLQAADLLAWFLRRALSKPVGNLEFDWITHKLITTTPMSRHCQWVPKERLEFQLGLSKVPEFAAQAIRIFQEYRDREGLSGEPF